ncbi:hypothetical protein U062_00743 [Gammaproteobacteria bacterium MOLA455]|nr:hypothetical protein U062_00743 [Gammaproteobacteria bacterium MOLA455]
MTFSGAKFISAFHLHDLLLNGDAFIGTLPQFDDERYIPKVKKRSQRMLLDCWQKLQVNWFCR